MGDYDKSYWNIWTTYAIYYFGKANLGLIMPLLLATQGFTKYNVGLVASGFFLAYAVGQFLHGQISERFNPYHYIVVGLVGSAIMNAFLGFFGMFFWLLFIGEVFDGFFQSMGWSSCVRAVSERSKNPAKAATILGTSYQIGNSVAWLVASFMIGWFGWQWGFWVAAIVMFIKAMILLKYAPKDYVVKKQTVAKQVKNTLTVPIVLAGAGLLLLNMVRFGVMTWIPTFLFEVEKLGIDKIGLKIFLFPIFGVLGTLLYNALKTDRENTTMIYMLGLATVFAIFPFADGGMLTTVLLLASGFFVYGVHVYLVSATPSQFRDKQVVAASTGLINGFGYIGTTLVGILVPFILDGYSWMYVFYFWSILAVLIIFLTIGIKVWKIKEARANAY